MSTNSLYIVFLAQNFAKIGFFISALLGFVLVFLTLFGVRKIIGTYKYLMVIFTILSIFLATMEIIFHPNLHFYNSGFVFFTLTLPFDLSRTAMESVLAIYAGVYSCTISLIAVQFIYRYWVLFSLPYLTYFRGPKSIIWFFYCLFFAASWYFGDCFLLSIDQVSENYFKSQILLHYNVFSSDIPMLAFLAYDPVDGSFRWRNFFYIVTISIVMNCQYGTMIYCGWKMYFKMEEKLENFSSAMKHHHRQLFKTLVLQITAPTILLFSPLIPIMFLPFFRLELDFPAGAAFGAFSYYPAMDSIIVLSVISEYRIAARRMWKSSKRNASSILHSTARRCSLRTTSQTVSTTVV